MGGVDLLDSFIGRSKIRLKSKKWYMRIFYHLLDITCANSWIIYKKIQQEKNEKFLSLPDFKTELAEFLCLTGAVTTTTRKSKISNLLQESIESKRIKKSAAHIPPKAVRTDGIQHYPVFEDSKTCRSRCKHINYDKLTNLKCTKCDVFLCLNANRNCFLAFHTN